MAHCYVQFLKPKQTVSLPIRSMHIKPSPVETDLIDVLLGIPRGKPRNLVNRNQATRRLRFLTSDRLLGTCAALKASTSTDILNLRTRPSSYLTRALTRL